MQRKIDPQINQNFSDYYYFINVLCFEARRPLTFLYNKKAQKVNNRLDKFNDFLMKVASKAATIAKKATMIAKKTTMIATIIEIVITKNHLNLSRRKFCSFLKSESNFSD